MIDSFETIAKILKGADKLLLFPHIGVDGDALGSSVALCRVLRNLGKSCYILLEDEIPDNLRFLDKGYCAWENKFHSEEYIAIALDCGEKKRLPMRYEDFQKAKLRICIDHHKQYVEFGEYNHVDTSACATGELIYKLIKTLGAPIDKEIGEALFAAIVTDSGRFMYSNTTKETHLIVADLYDCGIDGAEVNNNIFENQSVSKLKLQSMVVENMEFLKNGKICLAYVSQDMLKNSGASMDESSGIIAELRSIMGVEIAALVKEEDKEFCSISMRAKSYGNVAKIAEDLGGGGHIKAAGCKIRKPLLEVMEILRNKVPFGLIES